MGLLYYGKEQSEKIIYYNDKNLSWHANHDYSIDENGQYKSYGFIEILVKDEDIYNGYILLGTKNGYEGTGGYQYYFEQINSYYESSLNINFINEEIVTFKNKYMN